MLYDYRKLIGRIIEICGTQANFSKKMGLSERSISYKLNNKVPFKQSEIQKALEVLEIAPQDIEVYFFKSKVQNF